MKKFFKSIRKKSPARGGPPPGGSPVLGASRGSTASLVLGYEVKEKELGKLHKAAWNGDLAKVQQLAKKDPSPLDKENRTPLHLACAQGHDQIVQELLEWKAKTNIGDADSRTPLMKAVECRHEKCVELLLRDKVELDSVDIAGNTSLHIAAHDGSAKIVKMLCQAGANMSIKNKEGLAPLHVAVKEKHEDVCRIIISMRGQVDVEDTNLKTPLMYACQDGSISLVKFLLENGASTERRDAKGWSADDCAVIQGHHTCSQLISDHVHRNQRTSTTSTPRSNAGSRSATPRGPSPFALPAGAQDKDSVSFGLPAADAGGDDSGDETISKASGKGAGSDSWGDDTDISLAEDKKGKSGGTKINLAKLVGHLPSESDDGGDSLKVKDEGGGGDGFDETGGIKAKRPSNKSQQSETSMDDNSWAAADSPLTPRRSAVRVSFKGDKELSEVHDITATESEAESDHYYSSIPAEPVKQAPLQAGSGYVPSATASTSSLQLSPEKQREFMEDLGLGDVDDISEMSELSEAKPVARPAEAPPPPPPQSDSEWDSTVKSDPQTTPRPGILKKWKKVSLEDEEEVDAKGPASKQEVEEPSDWDSTVVEDPAPPLPTSPQPKLAQVSEWDIDDVEELVVPVPTGQIPKEVEVMMRRQQAEAQDSDEDDSSSQHNDVKALGASDLLSVTIEQSAKEYLGNDSFDTTPQGDALDKPSQDSEWDSATDVGTPRADTGAAKQDLVKQDSDWDTTTEAVTPRGNADISHGRTQQPNQDIVLSDEDEVEAAVAPSVFAPPKSTTPPPTVTRPTGPSSPLKMAPAAAAAVQPIAGGMVPEDEEEEESGWDSDGDMLPSDSAPPPVTTSQQKQQPQVQKQQHLEDMSDTDDEMEKTETISEWEMERKQAKQLHQQQHQEEEDITDLTEAGRTQPFEPQVQQEAVKFWQAREEEERRKREEEEEEARRQQEWEREEAARQERLRAEAEEALRMEQQAMEEEKASSEDESFAHEDLPKPVTSPTRQLTRTPDEFDSCQNNSSVMAATKVTSAQGLQVQQSKEELKRVEEQVREEARAKEVAALISTSSITSTTRPSQYTTPTVLHPQPSQGVPQSSHSSYLTGPTALQIKQRLQVGNPGHMAYHSDGMESDDSLVSDNERPENINSYYPALLGSTQSFKPDFNMADDDVLSYTSTEFENGDPVPTSTGPFSRDVLLNMNLSDPSTLVQVQDYIRETKRHMEQERNHRAMLENKLKLVTKEKQEMQKKLESMAEIRQSLEQNKLDLEARIRSLEYNFSEEQEKRRNAELLLTKTKEQLTRKEQNYTSELEAKQRAELTMRNIQLEMRAAQNTIKELEEEREELERQLQHEHNARMLQEQINEEQSRLAQQRRQETMASALKASRQSEAAHGDDTTDGEGRGERDKLNAELYAIKMEMDRQRSRFKDEITLLATENEELQNRVEDLKNEIKLNEEALAHATMQYNMQLGNLRSEASTAAASLEKERAAREKLETELESLQKRMLSANTEKDKAVQARNEMEREYQREKQSAARDKERKDEELAMLKDNNQHLNQRLHAMETKLNAMENELHVSNTSLMERTNQLQQLRQEAERHKMAQDNFDTNIRLEKELNTKLQVKIEGLQEKLSQSQHEVLSLKQQLENLRTAGLNSASSDTQEQLTAIITSLRSDSDRAKALLEERNNNLMEQVQHLKEEARNVDNRRNTLEADLHRLQAEHADVKHKLALAEAQLQMTQKAKDQLEQERAQLKVELEKANERHRLSQEKVVEAQARVSELTDRLDRAERTSQLSTQNLANTSATFSAVARSKEEMEEIVQRLQVENARLDADLRHERERAEMLQAELTDSIKVRSSLEALCSNLKSTTAHLEEKLGDETAHRVVLAHEARDAKNLLDQELSTRRHLGLKIVKLERAQKQSQVKFQEARKSSTEAEGQKTALESQLMEESQRNQQLQKEVNNLKSHLKAAKKKLKDVGVAPSPRGQGGSQYAEFQREVSAEGGKVSTPRGDTSNSHHHYHHVVKAQSESGYVDVDGLQQDMEARYRRELNRKLEEVNAFLESQTRVRDRLDTSRSENEARLVADKRRLEEENSNLKLQYEQAVAQRESREMESRRFKQLYESEMQWRMRLSDQLQHYTDKSTQLKPRFMASDRTKSRLHSSVGNLNMSAISNASIDISRINGDRDDALSNKIRAELDRSIAKHLEAAPHSDIVPVIRETEEALLGHSLARASKDYIDVLKRKYCV